MRITKKDTGIIMCGLFAGAVNGLLGTGGGMVLVPLLTGLTDLQDDEVFPASVSIILPICFISLFCSPQAAGLTLGELAPYLLGSIAGGILCGIFGKHIPVKWLHRTLGVLILWGGVRYLC